jgi:hypothetical protein
MRNFGNPPACFFETLKEAQAEQKLEEFFLARPQLAQEVRDHCTRIREREKDSGVGPPRDTRGRSIACYFRRVSGLIGAILRVGASEVAQALGM